MRAREDLPREPEELEPETVRPAETGVLELQRAVGNRAVTAMLARQPTEEKASEATAGLGDEIGVIPLESVSWGTGSPSGATGGAGHFETREAWIQFTLNAAAPAIAQAAATGTVIPKGFISTRSMTVDLADVLLSGYQQSERSVSVQLSFTSMKLRK